MFKSIIKAAIVAAALALSCTAMGQTGKRVKPAKPAKETIKLGAEIKQQSDSLDGKRRRGLQQHLIIPKGEWQVGALISHVSFSSDDSEYLLIVQNLDANGSITKVAPFVAYSYRDNRSIGIKLQYSSANGNIREGDLDFLSDDLNFSVDDIRANMSSFQTAVYHRSYIGLDDRGRIGLFNDISLSYTNSKTVFTYNAETADTYTRSNQIKLSLQPGIVVFAMNNVSTHVSIGIGGVSYNNTKYIKAGEVIGTRNYSQAKFKLNVLDINIGVTIHL